MTTTPILIDLTKLNTAELNKLYSELRKGYISQSVLSDITQILKLREVRNRALLDIGNTLPNVKEELIRIYDELEVTDNKLFNINLADYLVKMNNRIAIINNAVKTFSSNTEGESNGN